MQRELNTMIEKNATTQQQRCINHCSQSDGTECCRTCHFINDTTSFSEAGQARDSQTNRVLSQLDQSIEKTKELTDTDLYQSANRADVFVALWFAVGILIAVMAVMGSGA